MFALAELLLTYSMQKLLKFESKQPFFYDLRDIVIKSDLVDAKEFYKQYFLDDQWSKSHDKEMCGEAVNEILICENQICDMSVSERDKLGKCQEF